MYSNMSPDSPCNPSRLPAIEKDWHGLPPTTRSGLPHFLTKLLQFTFVTSPKFGTFGYLSARTADGNGSISANARASHPIPSQATLAASIPLNRLRYLTSYSSSNHSSGTSQSSSPCRPSW